MKTTLPAQPLPSFMSTASPPRSTMPIYTALRVSTILRLSAWRICSQLPPLPFWNGPNASPSSPPGPSSRRDWTISEATPPESPICSLSVIRTFTRTTYLPGIELRTTRGPDSAAFRKLLSELLQSALTQAKYQKNIEIDLLFRLGLLKFLTFEIGNQFANLILEGKEWIRKRGEHFERSQQAHVIKARLSELQSARRGVIRRVGQQVAQIVSDVEDNVIAKARRAMFGEDFTVYNELCKNGLIFLDGGKDDVFFLEHYVLLGNYARDPDRFEAMDELFQEFLREAGVTFSHDPAHTEAIQAHTGLLEAVQAIQSEITNLEEQRENTRKRL